MTKFVIRNFEFHVFSRPNHCSKSRQFCRENRTFFGFFGRNLEKGSQIADTTSQCGPDSTPASDMMEETTTTRQAVRKTCLSMHIFQKHPKSKIGRPKTSKIGWCISDVRNLKLDVRNHPKLENALINMSLAPSVVLSWFLAVQKPSLGRHRY